jgi:hypothetical protein
MKEKTGDYSRSVVLGLSNSLLDKEGENDHKEGGTYIWQPFDRIDFSARNIVIFYMS